jgi:hypothetical protein
MAGRMVGIGPAFRSAGVSLALRNEGPALLIFLTFSNRPVPEHQNNLDESLRRLP